MHPTRRQFIDFLIAAFGRIADGCSSKSVSRVDDRSVAPIEDPSPASGTLRISFSSAITRGYAYGDCILVEYHALDDTSLFGLLDTGIKIKTQDGTSTSTLDYLSAHGVETLEFLVLTHMHGDHAGDALSVLETIPVKTLYIKQYDYAFSHGMSQGKYEAILKTAYANGTHVVGVDPRSVDLSFDKLSKACPSMTDAFKEWIANNQQIQEWLEPFSEENTTIELGEVHLAFVNWETWAEDGTLWDMDSEVLHETVANDNNNSLGVIVGFRDTKYLLAGDMNNLDSEGPLALGDEERLKAAIGKVDFLKLNHHGYSNSNTIPFLNAILPSFAVITNDLGFVAGGTRRWLDDHGVDYVFTTSDPTGVVVLSDGQDVAVKHETRERFARSGDSVIYLTEIGSSPQQVVYEEALTSASSWGELNDLIAKNASSWRRDGKGKIVVTALRINVNALDGCEADSCCAILPGQRIVLVADAETTVMRSPSLIRDPFFYVQGELALEGPVILDGNSSAMNCTASLIWNEGGTLSLSGATLRNNAKTWDARGKRLGLQSCYGGAILAMDGATTLTNNSTLSGNTCSVEGALPFDSSRAWRCGGGAIAVLGGILVIDGARVVENSCKQNVPIPQDDGDTIQTISLLGGGIIATNGATCTWRNLELCGNSLLDGLAGNEDNAEHIAIGKEYGGGCYVKHSSVTIVNSRIEGNECSLQSDSVDARGGGLAFESCSLLIEGTTITDNSGAFRGGGLALTNATSHLKDCTLASNRVTSVGGALSINGANLARTYVENCTFIENVAQGSDGGAIWTNGQMAVSESVFKNNTAAGRGGAISSVRGLAVDEKSTFMGNVAKSALDIVIGNSPASFYRLGADVDCKIGKSASRDPLDDGPSLQTVAHKRGAAAPGWVIGINITSSTGISRVLVNGEEILSKRYIAEDDGSYTIEVYDLAGRKTSKTIKT